MSRADIARGKGIKAVLQDASVEEDYSICTCPSLDSLRKGIKIVMKNASPTVIEQEEPKCKYPSLYSFKSYSSGLSIFAVFSFLSFCSVFGFSTVNSLISVLSCNAILSIMSVNSILSVMSYNCILCLYCDNNFLCINNMTQY